MNYYVNMNLQIAQEIHLVAAKKISETARKTIYVYTEVNIYHGKTDLHITPVIQKLNFYYIDNQFI